MYCPADFGQKLEMPDVATSSDDYAARFLGPTGAWFLAVQRAATLEMLAPYASATILDVGGGHGQVAEALVDAGHELTVFGSNLECQRQIRDLLNQSKCNFEAGNLLSLPFPNQSFDIVLCYRLLPHVTNWRALVTQLARVARHAVLLDYPEMRSVNILSQSSYRLKRWVEGNTRPYRCYRLEDLKRQLRSLGFECQHRYPEFLLPMVFHRMLSSPDLSSRLEARLRSIGLTERWGSPVIVKFRRDDRIGQ